MANATVDRSRRETASKGQKKVEFELNLGRSFDLQKLRRELIEFERHTFCAHIDCLLCAGNSSVPWLVENGPGK